MSETQSKPRLRKAKRRTGQRVYVQVRDPQTNQSRNFTVDDITPAQFEQLVRRALAA